MFHSKRRCSANSCNLWTMSSKSWVLSPTSSATPEYASSWRITVQWSVKTFRKCLYNFFLCKSNDLVGQLNISNEHLYRIFKLVWWRSSSCSVRFDSNTSFKQHDVYNFIEMNSLRACLFIGRWTHPARKWSQGGLEMLHEVIRQCLVHDGKQQDPVWQLVP